MFHLFIIALFHDFLLLFVEFLFFSCRVRIFVLGRSSGFLYCLVREIIKKTQLIAIKNRELGLKKESV